MANCPSCSAALTEDFGLIECSSCGSPLIIHVDGSVEAAATLPPPEPQAFNQSFATPDFAVDANESAPAAEEDFLLNTEPERPSADAPALDAVIAEEFGAADTFDPPENAEEPPPEPATSPELDEVEALFAEEPDPAEDKRDFFAEEEEPAPSAAASPDLSDIAKFGNSESTGSRDGTLRYNVVVGGIDTSDVREAFREALTDRKFMWDTDEILRSIHDGEVRIENVVASKAFVLVARLRSLPVRIHWEQYAVHSN